MGTAGTTCSLCDAVKNGEGARVVAAGKIAAALARGGGDDDDAHAYASAVPSPGGGALDAPRPIPAGVDPEAHAPHCMPRAW